MIWTARQASTIKLLFQHARPICQASLSPAGCGSLLYLRIAGKREQVLSAKKESEEAEVRGPAS